MRIVLLAFLVSCTPVVEEPPAQSVASRRQIAAGSFRGLGMEGSRDTSARIVEPGTIVTLAEPDETGGTLSLLPFDGGDGCAAGRAAAFETHNVGYFDGVLLSLDPIRTSVWDTIDDARGGQFRFVDGACADAPAVADPLAVAPFRDFSTPYEDVAERVAPPYVVWTATGDVLRVDPWTEEIVEIATGVTLFETGWWDPDEDVYPSLLLFLVEDGQLVVRDSMGVELARAGSGVREVSVACPVRQEDRTNYLEGACPEPDAAYVDDSGLHLMSRGDFVVNDACQPRYLGGIRSLDSETPAVLVPTLAYLHPCADRTLVLRELVEDGETTYSSGVFDARRLWNGTILYVLGDGPVDGVGTAFVATQGSEPIEIAPGVQLETVEPYAVGLLVLANFDGTSGDLGVWTDATGFLPAKSGVAELEADVLLAVLTEFDGETGTLEVVDVLTGASQVEPGEDLLDPASILEADGVPLGGFRWSESTYALDYLEAFDPAAGTGTLRTWIVPDSLSSGGPGGTPIDGEEGFLVDEHVSEWLEIQWPDAGELYIVEDGERDGIWYADWRE